MRGGTSQGPVRAGGGTQEHPLRPSLTLRPGFPRLVLLALGPRVQVALGVLDLEGSFLLDWRNDSL